MPGMLHEDPRKQGTAVDLVGVGNWGVGGNGQ